MKTNAELLADAQALDASYARAEAFDAAQRETEVIGYKVIWDNGNDCGELMGGPFETEEQATQFGEDWACEMQAIDPDAEEDTYTFDVVDVMGEPESSDDDLAFAEEAAWYEELNRGYAQDRL